MNQLVELFDLVAQFDGERVGLKLAGVADCFHCRKKLFSNQNPTVGIRLAETGKKVRRVSFNALFGSGALKGY
jgi:hypothetical protein